MRRVLLLITVVTVAAAWFAWLRPTVLGGDASYVIVDGSSMEPTYEDGDLVLVTEQESYRHGDVIAFRAGGRFNDPTRIIHRIVGDDDRGFITQGDNRDSTDPWFPTDDDIIGRASVHLPMAGDVAGLVSRPEFFAALGGMAVVMGGTRRRRRRRHNAAPVDAEVDVVTPSEMPGRTLTKSRSHRFAEPRWAFVGLVVSVALAVPVLALAWSALRAPDVVQITETTGSIDYSIGVDYSFRGTPSAVYPSGTVESTENAGGALVPDGPLYSRLLQQLELTLVFNAVEQGAERLTTSYDLDVDVSTPAGWTTTLESVESTTFEKPTTESVKIDLREVAKQVAAVGELTGVGGDAYTIAVRPTLSVVGGTETTVVDDQLTAPMTFTVEGNLISAEAIESSDSRPLTTTASAPAEYAVGPFEMRTQPARAVLSGLALVLVAGMVWFASVLFGGVGLREPDRIAVRYRSQMVDVAVATAPPGPVVMVGGIDELSRIAKMEQSVILHEDLGEGAHRYRVFLGSVTYEYETAPEHPGAVGDDVAATDESSG